MPGIYESASTESTQEQAQAPKSGERSKLVQRLLDGGPNLQAYLNDMLTVQAVTVAGTEAAAFVIDRNQPQFTLQAVAHIRPDNSDAPTRAAAVAAFQQLVRPCVTEGKDAALEVGPPNTQEERQYLLATLLRTETEIVAISAVITRCRNMDLARQRLTSMQLVAGYFELYNLKRSSESNRAIAMSHQRVLQLSRAVADASGFHSAAMNLCNELATAAGATRVSLGWIKGRNIKIRALSPHRGVRQEAGADRPARKHDGRVPRQRRAGAVRPVGQQQPDRHSSGGHPQPRPGRAHRAVAAAAASGRN